RYAQIDGIVLTSEHSPTPRARVMVYDSADHVAAQAFADAAGRFQLRVFADTAYRLHAVWPNTPDKAVSAVPVDIVPGTEPLSLQLILDQPGNSVLQSGRKGPGAINVNSAAFIMNTNCGGLQRDQRCVSIASDFIFAEDSERVDHAEDLPEAVLEKSRS